MILEVKNLTREFCRNDIRFSAVDHVDFEVVPGKLTAIIGQSGSGKSTLFHLISGMIQPTEGEIKILGQDVAKMNESQKATLRGTDLAYIMQGHNLLHNFTVLENLYMPSSLNGKTVSKEMAESLMTEFGIANLCEEYPANLSGGEQRRVAIARAFMQSPKLVIADEPTSNLDPENSHVIMVFFKKMTEKGITVLVSTHDMDFVDYADVCYRMKNGQLMQEKIGKEG